MVGGVVGREADLVRIDTALDRALAEEPSLLLIFGEAGIGKTTLLEAGARLATAKGFATLLGRCVDGASGSAFAPVRGALRAMPNVFGQAQVQAAVDRNPVAAILMPPPLGREMTADTASDAGMLYEAVLEILIELAGDRPLLFAIEDLHWADRSTLELLSFLARNLADERLVLAGTARSEGSDLEPATERALTELGRLRTGERIDLEGLGIPALRELVESHAGRPMEESKIRELHARTAGNAFFALALLNADAQPGTLPRSVTDALATRLKDLDPDDAALLRAAAVVGPTVDASLLGAVTGRSEEEVERAIRAALEAGAFVADTESESIRFRHALVQEVAYAELLSSERRRLHDATARELAHHAPVDPATLAYHYTRANRPADALGTSVAAARASAGAYGSLDAVAHYSRAVETWNLVRPEQRPDVDLADLLQEAMLCAVNVGAIPEAAQFGTRLLDVIDPRAEPERWSLVAARMAEITWEQSDPATAQALLDRAGRYLEGLGDSPARVRVLERKAFHSTVGGHREGARELAYEALAVARRIGDPESEAIALNRVALAETVAGTMEGRRLLWEAFEHAWRAGLPHETTRAAVNLVLLLHTGGMLDEAIRAAQRALTAADELGIGRSNRNVFSVFWARALLDIGDFETAVDILADIRLPTMRRLSSYVNLGLAESSLARGDYEATRRALDEPVFDPVLVLVVRRACVEAELLLAEGAKHDVLGLVERQLPTAALIRETSYFRMCVAALHALAGTDDVAGADRYLGLALERREFFESTENKPPELDAWLYAVRASHADVIGSASSEIWGDAAAEFDRTRFAVRGAWARLQQARALVDEGRRDEARGVIGEIHAFAQGIGAQPLRRGAEHLARSARLDVAGVVSRASTDVGLTDRERDVLRLVAEGRTNREIAEALYISVKTASVHVSNILRKVGATNRVEAAAVAHRQGLVTTPRES